MSSKKQMSKVEAHNRFNQLRQEQKAITSKINELENEKREHTLVVDAMKDLDPNRKCFRLIGGVLVERNVKEVLPALKNNEKGLAEILKQLQEQLISKGKEINLIKKEYDIQVGEQNRGGVSAEDGSSEKKPKSSGVLV